MNGTTHMLDRHFVPNLTIGAPVIKALRKHTDAFLDCHLMVSKPEQVRFSCRLLRLMVMLLGMEHVME